MFLTSELNETLGVFNQTQVFERFIAESSQLIATEKRTSLLHHNNK
jgi:hypothetical protein